MALVPVLKIRPPYNPQITQHPRVLPFGYGDRFIPRRYHTAGNGVPDVSLPYQLGGLPHRSLAFRTRGGYGTAAGEASDIRPDKLDDPDSVDILDMRQIDGYWRLNGLRDSLDKVFGLNGGGRQRVLHLHDWLTECVCRRTLNKRPSLATYQRRYENVLGLDWPCVPRTRPVAFTNSSHDLPGFHRFSREY